MTGVLAMTGVDPAAQTRQPYCAPRRIVVAGRATLRTRVTAVSLSPLRYAIESTTAQTAAHTMSAIANMNPIPGHAQNTAASNIAPTIYAVFNPSASSSLITD